MTSASAGDVTQLLNQMNQGDEAAADSLIRVVYEELKAVATAQMRAERDEHTLQPTALVNEAYIRLVDQRRVVWQGRSHFFCIAAQAMRRVLIDHARKRNAQRRGGGKQVTLMDRHAAAQDDPIDLIALDNALEKLSKTSERQARTAELRYFGGLGIRETAEVLGVSEITVKRDWRYAKAWLYREIEAGQGDRPRPAGR